MRSPRWTTRQPIILMTSAAVLLGARGWACGQEALPGSALSLRRAKQEARFIVVAEVGKTGDVLGSCLTWTELKPSTVLKGKVDEEELNKLPLSIQVQGKERFPKSGEEFVFFIGDPWGIASITKMLPKTEEDLAAIEAAMPEPRAEAVGLHPGGGIGGRGGVGGGNVGGGLGGGGLGRGGSPLKPAPPPSYRGTKIVPDKGATGDMLEVQDEFAAAMSRDDPKSEDRQAHFAWLDRNEYVRRYGVRQVGWYGGVLGCEPRPGGGWLVKVVIRPWLYPTVYLRHTFVLDTVEETYEFVGGRVRMVESNAAIAKPGLQVFPIAW